MTSLIVASIAVTISPFTPQPVLIGPFKLGDLILLKLDDNSLAKKLKAAGVDVGDVKAAMNKSQFFIIDYKVRGGDGRWTWYRPGKPGKRERIPRGVVGESTAFKFNSPDGAPIEIRLTEAKLALDRTNSDWGKKGDPPVVTAGLGLTLEFDGLVVPLGGGVTGRPKRSEMSIDLRYDVTGRGKIDER